MIELTQQSTRRLSRYFITDKAFYKQALMIFIPVLLQSLINSGVNLMDNIMVGTLGEASISAVSLANQFYGLFNIIVMGLAAAGMVLSSQYFGAGDLRAVRRVFDFVLQLVGVTAILFAIVTFLLPGPIMRLYTADADVIEHGIGYLRITAFVYLVHGIAMALQHLVRSTGDAKLGLYVSIASFIVNIGANWVFIFGKLGAPAMGASGAALGTLIARVVELVFALIYIHKHEKNLNYRPVGLVKLPSKSLFKEFIRLGLPIIISDTLLALAFNVNAIILGHMGKAVTAAYAIVMNIDRIATLAIFGLSSCASVILGQTVGRGAFEEAKRQGWTFLALSVIVGILGGIIVWFIGVDAVVWLKYNITDETFGIMRSMMHASAFIVLFQSIQSSLGKGVLRGAGDSVFLMYADVLFQWVASLPLGALTGLVLHWDPSIVLIALKIDNFIKAIWLIYRMSGNKWIHQAKKIEHTADEPD
ncbi:MAG: MATE family efflux transporter [Oscillospiraceae bacterium]|nr:MATE family efflux transporter [Oscillospiraceae bacterium]